MIKLLGHSANDVLAEWLGPITGRNYFNGAGNLAVYIQVQGTGTVSLQSNSVPRFRNVGGDPSKHSMEMIPTENNWLAISGGTNITQANGLVKVTLTAGSAPNWLRIFLNDPGQGDGIVIVRSDWK